METCFVTGSTGFVGLNFVEEMLSRGTCSVLYCLVRKESARLRYLNQLIEGHKETSSTKVILVYGDITDIKVLKEVFPNDVDAIYHIAASIILGTHSSGEQNHVNIDGTKNMINVVLEKAPKARFIHVSSISVYGKGTPEEEKTYKSETMREISETTKKNGMNDPINYGKSKYFADVEVHKAIQEKGLDAFILQPCSMMGENDFLVTSWNQLARKIKRDELLGTPGGCLCLCDVKAFCRTMCDSYERGKTGEEYLIGGVNVSFKQVSDVVTKYYGKKDLSILPHSLFWTIGLLSEIGYGIRNLACVLVLYCCWTQKKKYALLNRHLVTSLYYKYSVDTSKAINELGYQVTELEDLVVRSCKFIDSLDDDTKKED